MEIRTGPAHAFIRPISEDPAEPWTEIGEVTGMTLGPPGHQAEPSTPAPQRCDCILCQVERGDA